MFRTYNASVTLQKELPYNLPLEEPFAQKVVTYNDANRKVAILCNHQRTVPKGFEAQLEKLNSQHEQLISQLKELENMEIRVKKGKSIKLKSNSEDPEVKKSESHLYTKQPTKEQIKTRIDSW